MYTVVVRAHVGRHDAAALGVTGGGAKISINPELCKYLSPMFELAFNDAIT